MKKSLPKILAVGLILALVLLSLGSAPGAGSAQPPVPRKPKPLTDELRRAWEVSPELAMSKIVPSLRDLAQAGGKEAVPVVVEVKAGTDLSAYLSDLLVRPFIFRGNQMVYGTVQANDLLALASMVQVTAIGSNELNADQMVVDGPFAPDHEVDEAARQERLDAIRAIDVPFAEAPAPEVRAEGWFDVLDGHKSSKAWEKGFTGEGVVVGVIDDGIDFGHPDLMGTTARVTDPDSPYYGWPMAFSENSMIYYANDMYWGTTFVHDGGYGIWYADTSETRAVYGNWDGIAKIKYTPLTGYAKWGIEHEYIIPATSQSHVAHIGSFPDVDLQFLYGERVAVLVMDEHVAGVYDTVYVDLDNDYDFTDEKPARRGNEYIYRDMDGDGYTDISGGMVQWIADGTNPLPIADWLWGLGWADDVQDFGEPGAGDLVMFSGAYDLGYSHGTNCGSNIAAQGVVNGGLTAQPFRVGGMVQGAAPDAGLMNFGNFYRTPSGPRQDDVYFVAALGYDGISYSNDECQITTNSYGAFGQYFTNWSYYDRLIADVNHTVGRNTTYVFSYGNDGPGYTTNEGEAGVTALKVSSSSQYGSTNWDSIVSIDQVVYGDVTGFASNGPDFDGNIAPDVLANGGRGSGSEKINYYGFNGWTSWATWGGTSRSGPVAGGNLALVYQAYKARYGVWPTYQEAKDFLLAGANDAKADPTLQGAGVVNADRATDLAAGIYGVYATPTRWNAGDYRGTDYESFAHMVSPGDTVNKTFTVHNPSGYNITVGLSDGILTQIGDAVEIPWTSAYLKEESGFNFHSPDYLVPIDPNLIPADADLMVVRFVQPLTQYDPDGDYTTENHWRHLVYKWTDLNGDGKLWEDRNGNSVVNHVDDLAAGPDNDGFYRLDFSAPGTETQEGEYIRLDYNFAGNTDQLTIRDPLDRMGDGMFIGLQHRRSTTDLPISSMTFYLEFYKRVDWPWLSLSDAWVTVPAYGSGTFQATMAVPADAPYGFYDGSILIADPGDAYHDAHTSLLPVGVNVAAELSTDAITFGGGAATNRMYDNNVVRGFGKWEQGGWSILGDWRHFYVDVPEDAIGEGDRLLVHTEWDDAAPTANAPLATDIDTYILGPLVDEFSDPTWSHWWYGIPGDPTVFGPYTLRVIGTSKTDNRGGGVWGFSTWTGDTEDWAIAPLGTEGLYEIGLHNGLFAANKPEVPFKATVGVLSVGADLGDTPGVIESNPINATVYTDTGTVTVWFTSTLELPDLNANLSGGLVDTMYGPFTSYVPDTGECYSAWCAGNIYEPFMVAAGTTRIVLHLIVPAGEDADLFLVYDADDNGVPEQAYDEVVGSSGNAAGTDEEIVLNNPRPGLYFAALDGYDVTDPGVDLDWWYQLTAPGPLPVDAAEVFSDTLTVGQDDPLDLTTASFSTTVKMTERIAALSATLTEVDAADVDLYVTDETGAIVAKSQTGGTADEAVILLPLIGEYRFEEGAEYTVWVQGYNVPTPPADVHLNITWYVLNVWLSSEHADVHAADIGAGEGVGLTVHFDKPGWLPGDPDLSTRVTAGPDGFVTAFDELVVITRGQAPTPAWDPANLTVEYTVESARGPSPVEPWWINDVPAPTALAANGEDVTWTLTVRNDDPLFATPVFTMHAEVDSITASLFGGDYYVQTFNDFVVTPTVGTYGYVPVSPYSGSPVVEWAGSLDVGEGYTMAWTATTDASMVPLGDHLSLVYDPVYWWTWDPYVWDGLAGGDVYYRSFRTTGSYKMSTPDTVLPGEIFTYNFSLANPSAEDRYVYLSDPLPDEVTFVSIMGDAAYDAGTHTVSWSGLLPGTSLSTIDFDVVVQAKPDLAYNTFIFNEAMLSDKLGGYPFAYFFAETTVSSGAGLAIEKSVDDINALVGDTLNYTIAFRNTGTEVARGVTMTDKVPAELDVIAGTVAATKASTSVYDLYEDGLIRWEGDLAPDEMVTVTFQATINDAATTGLALINAARVSAANYPREVYSSALTEVFEVRKIYLPLMPKNYSPPIELTVLHTNDEHGWLEPFVAYGSPVTEGGAASLMGRFTQIEAYSPDRDGFLLLSAGDNWTGPSISTWFEGEPMVEVMNAMGYDASVIGNHEFDFGRDVLNERIAEADFPFLSANIYYTGTTTLADFVTPYIIEEVNGVKVGIVGLTTTETPWTTHPKNITDLYFGGYEEALRREVPNARAEGAELIIVESHVCSSNLATLAAAVSDLDIALMEGGHCHDTFTGQVGDTLIMEAYWAMRAYGKTVFYLDRFTRDVVDYTQEVILNQYVTEEGNPVTPDPAVQAIVDYWQAETDEAMGEIIGYTETGIARQSWKQANYVLDSWLWAYGTADFAMTNTGGFRADIDAGDITVGDIVGVLPFDNTIVDCAITGAQLVDNLECCGGAVAGFSYTYHTEDSQTVVDSVTLADGSPLDMNTTYHILVNDFMYLGGSGYLFGDQDPNAYDTAIHWRQPVIDWTRAQNTSATNPIDPLIDDQPRAVEITP